jgi:type I restriction enzyme R subunit
MLIHPGRLCRFLFHCHFDPDMKDSETLTRKCRIDKLLTAAPLNWTIVPWKRGLDVSTLEAHAVTEFPTHGGAADYALFVQGRLLGFVEAKKISVGAKNVLEQAKRYSRDVPNTVGDWRGFRVPFLYATCGEAIYHLDVRNKKNISCPIDNFHSPAALLEKLERDTPAAGQWFVRNPVRPFPETRLRYYQAEAVTAIENALRDGRRSMLLAMATGTGKTFTVVYLIYRLLKSGYARRILFLVDRRALAAQVAAEISAFQTPGGAKLDKTYEFYHQGFNREDVDGDMPFDMSMMPGEYLTQPTAKHSYIYVSTIQRMTMNLLGRDGSEGFEYDGDASQLDIPNHAFDVIIADECHRGYSASETGKWKRVLQYFDAVKIGLTATPARHTLGMFNHIVYSYWHDKAVEDGVLVDYDAVRVRSEVKIKGAFLKEGELVGEVDTDTGKETIVELEDEREFAAEEIEKKITVPDCTRKIIRALKKHTDAHQKEYGRFPKTLIFAANDLPHTSHADEVVRTCKEVFGKGDDFVMKITGSPTVDRPLEKIRRFRNRPEPRIVVTRDMLSTGVDIPALEFIVLMRPVKSRILWVQMMGRGTRRCDEINKEKFTVVDCFDGTLIEYFKNATDMDSRLCRESLGIDEVVERIYNNYDQEYYIKVLIRRLRRIEKNIGGEGIEQFKRFIPDGDIKAFTDKLRENLERDFIDTMKLLRNKDFLDLLTNYKRPKRPFYIAHETGDSVTDEVMFEVEDSYQRPEDYLKSFERYVRDNPDQIEAFEILLNRPPQWSTGVLEMLRKKLKSSDFREKDLQRAHGHVYRKPLADIISMIKHAADFQVPLLDAAERVTRAIEAVTAGKSFSEEQRNWLGYIKDHLEKNLAIDEEDFEAFPVFERRGGLKKAQEVFGEDLAEVLKELNGAIAA